MISIGIDCVSLNFSQEIQEFLNPWTGETVRGPTLLPWDVAQRTSSMRIVESHNPVLHQETGQLYLRMSDGGQLYVDSAIQQIPGPVHFKMAMRSHATPLLAQFVFDFAVASQLAIVLDIEP